jgi:hypothetical protein
MSIVENKKAFYDYFIEERYEAGLVLEGWEVKSIRAGRVQLKEAYVTLMGAEPFVIGMHISPLPTGIHPRSSRSHALEEAAAERRGDPQADRQGRAARLHAGAARPALQQGAREARRRARQGQEAARQARDREGKGLAARAAAPASQARMKKAGSRRLFI